MILLRVCDHVCLCVCMCYYHITTWALWWQQWDCVLYLEFKRWGNRLETWTPSLAPVSTNWELLASSPGVRWDLLQRPWNNLSWDHFHLSALFQCAHYICTDRYYTVYMVFLTLFRVLTLHQQFSHAINSCLEIQFLTAAEWSTWSTFYQITSATIYVLLSFGFSDFVYYK